MEKTLDKNEVVITTAKIAQIKESDLTKELVEKLAKYNETLIEDKRLYHNEAFMIVLENQHPLFHSEELSEESLSKLDGMALKLNGFEYIEII